MCTIHSCTRTCTRSWSAERINSVRKYTTRYTLHCVRVHYHTGNKCRVKESGEEKAEVRRVPALTFATKLDHAGDHLITRETCPTMMLNNLRLLIRAPPLPTLCRPVMFAKEVLW